MKYEIEVPDGASLIFSLHCEKCSSRCRCSEIAPTKKGYNRHFVCNQCGREMVVEIVKDEVKP